MQNDLKDDKIIFHLVSKKKDWFTWTELIWPLKNSKTIKNKLQKIRQQANALLFFYQFTAAELDGQRFDRYLYVTCWRVATTSGFFRAGFQNHCSKVRITFEKY